MVFTIDFTEQGVRRWSKTNTGVASSVDSTYTPTIYATSSGGLETLQQDIDTRRDVVSTSIIERRPGFRHSETEVLQLNLTSVNRIRPVATAIRSRELAGTNKCFNVDLSPQFRYCLETETDPTPTQPLTSCRLNIDETQLAKGDIDSITVDGAVITGSPQILIEALDSRLTETDPDVLLLSTAEIVPAVHQLATAVGLECSLGRKPGYEKLAGESTFESYGQVGHSPARYTVPGRAVIDRSNTFFYKESNLDGCLDLVSRSYKPIEELSWASIGNVLTAIQIREATERNVLIPWNSWRHEYFKPMSTLHEADRGGFTFEPDVGVHENVHELDFSSLYPNIIVTRNVSPETVRCECHRGRSDVPELGYSICDNRGYLCDVLEPLIEDRDAIKAEIRECTDPDRKAELDGKSSAIKWILVSCFGYQGFSNAKFGRLECHETINAYARDILIDAKTTLENHGWRILHGIVDSLWVTPAEGTTQTPLSDLTAKITDNTEIRLEYEATYDWTAFVPQRDSSRGALTKYFGRSAEGEYKYRGIECRQRSTPSFIADAQKELIDTFDSSRDPRIVCDRLSQLQAQLYRGEVETADLVITIRVSKKRSEYSQQTLTVAALERAADCGLSRSPGQSVQYVVVDDSKSSRDRVRLAVEEPTTYDPAYYARGLLRAATSVLSPLGWDEERIQSYHSETDGVSLSVF